VTLNEMKHFNPVSEGLRTIESTRMIWRNVGSPTLAPNAVSPTQAGLKTSVSGLPSLFLGSYGGV